MCPPHACWLSIVLQTKFKASVLRAINYLSPAYTNERRTEDYEAKELPSQKQFICAEDRNTQEPSLWKQLLLGISLWQVWRPKSHKLQQGLNATMCQTRHPYLEEGQ